MLDLLAVHELLFEEAELIMDAVADGGQVQRAERVHEARSETAEAAIAEAHVGFALKEGIEVLAHLAESGLGVIVEAGVAEVVLQKPTHEVFEREVMHAAHAFLTMQRAGLGGHVHHTVTHGEAGGHPPVVLGSRLDEGPQGEAEVVGDRGFERLSGVRRRAVERGFHGKGQRTKIGP